MAIKRKIPEPNSAKKEDNRAQNSQQNSGKIKAGSKSQQKSSNPNTQKAEDKTNLLFPKTTKEETENSEKQIRPQRLADYIGQKELKGILNIAITAAKGRKEALDHLLLYGPPGLGKTTMSLILASEMGVKCKITAAPSLERPRDIIRLFSDFCDSYYEKLKSISCCDSQKKRCHRERPKPTEKLPKLIALIN